MNGKEDWKKIDHKKNSVDILMMIKEIEFKFDTGKNIYMTTWKVKRDTANLFQKNKTSEIYLDKFMSNVQVEKQKECGIWLYDGKII